MLTEHLKFIHFHNQSFNFIVLIIKIKVTVIQQFLRAILIKLILTVIIIASSIIFVFFFIFFSSIYSLLQYLKRCLQ